MKQYIVIGNKGLIQAEDIKLIGSSTKRGEKGKIGQFGSGWKYALAWLMRNEAEPIIYAGKNRIVIETQMVQHRNNIVSVIYVDGKETSITTDMGMKWTAWMALRELISNAIDEGDDYVQSQWLSDSAIQNLLKDDYTTVLVPMNTQLEEVFSKYEYYFAFNRSADWVGSRGALYIRDKNELMNVYRKGIRCYDTYRETMVDFNFADIEITEDRLIEGGEGTFDSAARDILNDCDDYNVLKAAILSDYKDIHPHTPNQHYINTYRRMVEEGYKFTTRTYANVLGILADGIQIDSKHHAELIRLEIISNPMEAVFKHLDFAFARVDGPSELVEAILSRFGEYKVYFGKMDTHLPVKVKQNEFYIKETMVDKDVKYIAAKCLMALENGAEVLMTIL